MGIFSKLLKGSKDFIFVLLGAFVGIALGLAVISNIESTTLASLSLASPRLFLATLFVIGVLSLVSFWVMKIPNASAEKEASLAEKVSFDDLEEDRRSLEFAVKFAREVARSVDADEIRRMLQDMLQEWWSPGQWIVLSPEKAEEISSLPEEADLKLAISESASPLETSGTIIARHLESSVNRVIFTLRDATTLYAIVLAKRDTINENLAARAEIFLRVTVSALRTTTLLDSLVTSEKLAAVGRLAAGVAHEINNPLAFINLNLQVLERALNSRDSDLSEAVVDAREGAERITQIVQGMKLLSHTEDLNVELLDLVPLTRRTAKIARARNLTVPIQIEETGSVWIKGDEVRIGQIILNLMTNALDAARLSSNPYVKVVVQADTNLAIIDVIDNGPGIPEGFRDQLFTGVSTKGKRGSGLGLRISRSFARAHRGEIALVVTSSKGSVFRLSLPVSQARESTYTPASFTPTPLPNIKPKILVIDDEVAVVRALKRWLSQKADVDGTNDPTEGLKLARNNAYDLILCDLNMPQMMGTELIETLRVTDPFVAERAVIMTGSIDEQIPNIDVISKPIDIKVVSELIKRR